MDRKRNQWAIRCGGLIVVIIVIACGCGQEEKTGSTDTVKDGTVLEGMPDWYLDNPNSEDTLYARGTGVAADMIRAHTIAKNQAYKTIERVYDYTRVELASLPPKTIREHFFLVREGAKVRVYILIKIPWDKLH